MVLEQITEGAQRQLQVDNKTRRLSYILLLPMIDGVFATMLVSGYMETFSSIMNVAFTVFAGAGALSILYSEAESVQEARNMVKSVAPILLFGALIIGIMAPAFSAMFNPAQLKYATGLAVAAIALQIAGVKYADRISVPAIIVTGLVISLSGAPEPVLTVEYIIPAFATVSTALVGLYLASSLKDQIRVDYMRYGGSLVLLLISGSLFGLEIPSEAGLAVLAVSLAASLKA